MSDQQLLKTIASISASSFTSETARAEAHEALVAALIRVGSSWETTWRLIWREPAILTALKVCWDLSLFKKWVALGSDTPETAVELATLTGSDPAMLQRMLHVLACSYLLEQPTPDKYKMTPQCVAWATEPMGHAIPYAFDINIPGFQNLPAYLASTQYASPTDSMNGNWQHMAGNSEPFFNFLNGTPERAQDFQYVMQAFNEVKPHWTEMYPTERLVEDVKADRPVVVDMGGGQGHDLEWFRRKHPGVPAESLVLQDRPEVIEGTQGKLHPAIKATVHDLTTAQPVKGARAYYAHVVLHDWSDDAARHLLSRTAAAMEKGYSSLLIHEVIVEGRNALAASSDLTMMMALSARERTLDDWKTLLGSEGLVVREVFGTDGGHESLIEAVLA